MEKPKQEARNCELKTANCHSPGLQKMANKVNYEPTIRICKP